VSLYREAGSGRRRLAIVAGVAVAAALALAVALVLALGGEPSQSERLASLQDDVQPALAALELVPIHYESPNPTTHAAAAEQLQVARTAIDDVEPELRHRDAVGTDRLLRDLRGLEQLVRTTGRTTVVERRASEAAAALRELVGLGSGRG
jgi:hypothetical protein